MNLLPTAALTLSLLVPPVSVQSKMVPQTVQVQTVKVEAKDSFQKAAIQPRKQIPAQIKIAYGGKYKSSSFAYGNCTSYVASKRKGVNFLGNGGQWLTNAKAAGYKTGKKPLPGSIMVTNESYYGHVAYVERVNSDGSFLVSEMNYSGFGVVSKRTIKPGYHALKGFVY